MVIWTTHLEGGPRRVNHAAASIDHLIYSFGGYCTGDDYDNERPIDISVLNTVNNRWRRLPTPPSAAERKLMPFLRFGHTAVAYGVTIYIWGGRNNRDACNTLFAFNTETHKWTKPTVSGYAPGARDGHSACVIGKFMYVFGGFEAEVDHYSRDIYELDLELMHWRAVNTRGEPPRHRDFHTATAIGTRMYVFGGRGDVHGPIHTMSEVYCNHIMYIDTVDMVWHMPNVQGKIPMGRRSHSGFVYKENLYIFGGYNGILGDHFNDLHCFNTEDNLWREVFPSGQQPCKRRRQACIIVESKLFVFGGTSPATDDAEVIMPFNMEEVDEGADQLIDHSDLHVLDFDPTLMTHSILAVLRTHTMESLPIWLPRSLTALINTMVVNNDITPFE